MNAGIGNLGVSVVQFLTPMVISGAVFGASISGSGFEFLNRKPIRPQHSGWRMQALSG
jgi:NNP family nitrate/nitrite transporter-like MFS transporter